MPTIHLLVKGDVQGVFYRATAKKVADKFNITGWVKNTKDGDVEVIATGGEEQLQQFINWCKKGPEKAQVTDVIVSHKSEIIFDDFEVIRGK
ncbi:MAG: acylphosphatase [Chitinophagaceae bacterium]|nr:acylphosphatase [Chitinophagaceae bacterium]MDB5221433.1 acylphosphatase [Chitinophagaceae bacterium]